MFIKPKQTKYKKFRKGRLAKYEFKANKLKFGYIGLKALESGFITAKQLESSRQAITRKLKKKSKIWIKIFPNHPVSAKPTGVRMGKGKGQIKHWGAKILGGTVVFEIIGVNPIAVISALQTGKAKLPIKTKIIT